MVGSLPITFVQYMSIHLIIHFATSVSIHLINNHQWPGSIGTMLDDVVCFGLRALSFFFTILLFPSFSFKLILNVIFLQKSLIWYLHIFYSGQEEDPVLKARVLARPQKLHRLHNLDVNEIPNVQNCFYLVAMFLVCQLSLLFFLFCCSL